MYVEPKRENAKATYIIDDGGWVGWVLYVKVVSPKQGSTKKVPGHTSARAFVFNFSFPLVNLLLLVGHFASSTQWAHLLRRPLKRMSSNRYTPLHHNPFVTSHQLHSVNFLTGMAFHLH